MAGIDWNGWPDSFGISGRIGSEYPASQLPISHWHEYLGEATLADAILDRLVHNAYKIQLKGESMRKKKSPLTTKPT